MTYGRTAVTIYFVVVCGAILLALFFLAPTPVWLGALLIMLLTAAYLGIVRVMRRREEPVYYSAPSPPPEPFTRHSEHRVTEVSLPSSWEDYEFAFSATIRWSPAVRMDESAVNIEAMAVEAILNRARRITEDRPPGRVSLVQHELSGALGWMELDGRGFLHVMAESITLALSEEDRNRLAKLAAARKERTVWEHEMRYEQSRRAYLSENVLKDTGSAVVWWLAKNDDQVEKTVKDIESEFEGSSNLNIAVNCAGITVDKFMSKMDENDWDRVLNVNLKGTFFVTKAASKAM